MLTDLACALVVHGVNDWAHGKPAQAPAEQGVVDDVEEHCSNDAVEDLLQWQMCHLSIGCSQEGKGRYQLCPVLDGRPCMHR